MSERASDKTRRHRAEQLVWGRILLQTKQALNAEKTQCIYRKALDAADAFWKDAISRWKPEDGYRKAFAEVSVRGIEFAEYMGVLKALMGKGENTALGEEPEHFCAPEIDGLADNEKMSIETMGMFGGRENNRGRPPYLRIRLCG